MADLDEIQSLWADHDRKLDAVIALNRSVLTEASLSRARSALQRLRRDQLITAAFWGLAAVGLGGFVADHLGAPSLAGCAAMLDAYAVWGIQRHISQAVAVGRIDPARPVAEVQVDLAALRTVRIRDARIALFGGIILWAPAAVVLLSAFAGVQGVSIIWLVANIAFGIAIIPAASWAARRFGGGPRGGPWLARLGDDLAGSGLAEATRELARVRDFAAG
jgi:hypothetical protein